MSSQPVEMGGFGSGSIYIDTEGTFRPERVEQIAPPVDLIQQVF